MMKYKGAYSADTDYSKDDVVVFTDNIAYQAFKDPPAGATPHNRLYWLRLPDDLQAVVMMFHDTFASLATSVAAFDGVIYDSKTLVLASSTEDSDKVYAITVEDGDSGGELVATEVTD